MTPLSADDLAHLARLARLDLPADRLPQYAEQIGQILALFDTLQAIDTSDIGGLVGSFDDLSLKPRPDEPGGSLAREAALSPSGRRVGDLLTVPRVVGGAAAAAED